jgi:hypothetical protein
MQIKEDIRQMETMYERIKRMTPEEMKEFVYWVYLNGNRDGERGYEDSPGSYFGGHMLTMNAKQVMPDDSTDDLWDNFEETYGGW